MRPTGECMYCGQSDVRLTSCGALQTKHLIWDGATHTFCNAPMGTRPGSLAEHLAETLGVSPTTRLDVLLSKVATLRRNYENAERRLDELGVTDGGYAKLSVLGRIDELIR